MIQIQSQSQFTKAIDRCVKGSLFVRATGEREYQVINRVTDARYTVTFSVVDGRRFGHCNCAAGEPMHGNRCPLVCKHLAAALGAHLAIMAARRKAQTSH